MRGRSAHSSNCTLVVYSSRWVPKTDKLRRILQRILPEVKIMKRLKFFLLLLTSTLVPLYLQLPSPISFVCSVSPPLRSSHWPNPPQLATPTKLLSLAALSFLWINSPILTKMANSQPPSEPPTSSFCSLCSNPIYDQFFVRVKSSSFHEDCLSCSVCKIPLQNVCYNRNGNFFCKPDYDRYVEKKIVPNRKLVALLIISLLTIH